MTKVINVSVKTPTELNHLLSQEQAQNIYKGRHIIKKKNIDFKYMLSVVFAGGIGRNLSVITLAKIWDQAHRVDIIKIPLCHEFADIQAMTVCIQKHLHKYPGIEILLDANGAGMGLAQNLRSLGILFREIHWGGECFASANKKLYVNRRTQATVCLAKAIQQGLFKVLNKKHKQKVLEQLCVIPYVLDEKNRYKVLSKGEMHRHGLPIPDVLDTLSALFLEGAIVTSLSM